MSFFHVNGSNGVSPFVVQDAISNAQARHAASIRSDSKRKSVGHVAAGRALIRAFAEDIVSQARKQGIRGDVSDSRKLEIMEAIASGLGYREDGGSIVVDGWSGGRNDSYFFPGDLIDRNGGIARQSPNIHAVSETLTVRSYDPAMQLVQTRGVRQTGTVAHHKMGQTQIPVADFEVGASNKQNHFFCVKTVMPWELALYGGVGGLDVVEEKARAARYALEDAREQILVNGYTGTDLVGIAQLPIPTYTSAVDMADPATSIEDAYEDIMAGVLSFQEANNDKGGEPNAALIGSSLLRKLLPKNNLSAGGFLSGADLFAALSRNNQALGQLFRQLGIDMVIKAPSLNNFGGDSTKSAMLLFQSPATPNGIRQMIGLAPSPVRTASTLAGDETLWAMSLAGLESATTEACGLYVGKVG